MNKSNKLKAFTLSEVLITLVIIGIISAIAVPTIITSVNKNSAIEQLKKAYSTLSQASSRAISDNGPIGTWDVVSSSQEFSQTYMEPYLNTIGKKEYSTIEYKTLNNIDVPFDCYNFKLVDGTRIGIDTPDYNDSEVEGAFIVPILVDVNGDKKPNKLGRDIFTFQFYISNEISPIKVGTFLPFGHSWSREKIKSDETFGCSRKSSGMTCASLIMKDSWQMKADYPW